MAEHWIDQNKHKAKGAFERTGHAAQPTQQRQPIASKEAPTPQLTPRGPMRDTVDRQVREKQAAIKAKFARDREIERER